jgi:DNA anti-recombination protein RmuC
MFLRKREANDDNSFNLLNKRLNQIIRSEIGKQHEREQLIKELIEENKKLKEDIEVLERGD